MEEICHFPVPQNAYCSSSWYCLFVRRSCPYRWQSADVDGNASTAATVILKPTLAKILTVSCKKPAIRLSSPFYNDTFPLWYNQEKTQGFPYLVLYCTLVTSVNYRRDWYYRPGWSAPAYDSPSLPITWDRMDYVEGTKLIHSLKSRYKTKRKTLNIGSLGPS